MFTIEHEFDATVITLIDDPASFRQEDVIVQAFEECVTVEQRDPRTDRLMRVTFSPSQIADLAAALNLPEGSYSRRRRDPGSPRSE